MNERTPKIYQTLRNIKANRKRIVIIKKNNAFKVTWKESKKMFENEFIAKEKNRKSHLWYELGVYFNSIINVSGLNVSMAQKLEEVTLLEEHVLGLTKILTNRMKLYHTQNWWGIFSPTLFNITWDYLADNEKKIITNYLDGFKMPVTSSHGDLRPSNIMLDKNQNLKIIDWEFYRITGSVVTDLLRLHLIFYYNYYKIYEFQNKKQDPKYYEYFDFDKFINFGVFSKLSNYLETDEKTLTVLSGIAAVSSSPPAGNEITTYAKRLKIGLNNSKILGNL